MLKNKLKIIALFMVIILSLALPIVKADDETNNNPIQTPDDETTASIDENTSNPDSASPIAVDPSTNTSKTYLLLQTMLQLMHKLAEMPLFALIVLQLENKVISLAIYLLSLKML